MELAVTTATPTIEPMHSVSVPASEFVAYCETLTYNTTHGLEFIDITEHVRGVVERSGVAFGQVVVFSSHTTAAVIINEHEPLLLNDIARVLSRIAPVDDYYAHNDFQIRTVNMSANEPENGHSHCQHLLLGSSVTIPVHAGQARMGRWQSCFLVELDHARVREIVVQITGARAVS
ncbi:MAG: YjbQ family protein [Dehalococcoidia bacterium]|nr:YjbQ family protein [Dehalococcoidia bacterium]